MKILLIEDAYFAISNFAEALEGVAIIVLPPTFPKLPWDRKTRPWLHFPPLEEMRNFIERSDADIVLLDINLGTTYKGWDLLSACKGKKVVCISLDEYEGDEWKTWSKKGHLYPSNKKLRKEFVKFLRDL